uniref:Ras-GEF domain-containing protein n=1 Tax=Spongospora subterranea TaxID=70186 RepID=A0A0H5RAD9_9EUKA|eukprot:CRZ11120.1 hypothetical protein [Spongospora subterranea]
MDNGNMPLFERMLQLDPVDIVHALAIKANSLYMSLTPTSIIQAAADIGDNETTAPVYDMLRDWKFTEQWAERAVLSFRRSDTEGRVAVIEWLISVMRTCKSIGDLHHASAILAALKNPSIIRLPEISDAVTIQLNKSQVLQAAEIISKEASYQAYLARRLDAKVSTTPILRILMDHLRIVTIKAREQELQQSPVNKNSKLIRMFTSFNAGDDDGPNRRIQQFLTFQQFDFESALQKRSLKKKNQDNFSEITSFLKASYELGEQTYSQPTLIMSLSNRLLPWPEVFPPDGTILVANHRRLLSRVQSSMRLGSAKRAASVLEANSDRKSGSISNESPIHCLCQCFWGGDYRKDGGGQATPGLASASTPAEKRTRMLTILDDLVMQASQRSSQFPSGEWEAVLIASLACLQAGDERPFRLLIITESTLLNWHFENRPGGLADRVRSIFNELTGYFGSVDDITDVQRLILFSLCSRVSHHVQEFKHDPDRPQWSNLKDLMQCVVSFVYIEDGPVVFASVDALYDKGTCLDEGLLIVCDQILNKALRDDVEQLVNSTANSSTLSNDSRTQFKKTIASLRSVQTMVKESLTILQNIKSFPDDDRESNLFFAVKPIRRLLLETQKTFEKGGMTARLKSLIPFKSSNSPPISAAKNNQEQSTKSKRLSLPSTQDKAMLISPVIVGELARQALAESIERHKNSQRESPTMIRRISSRIVRRKSVSEYDMPNVDHFDQETIASLTSSSKPSYELNHGAVYSPQTGHGGHNHHRRRSSFPSMVLVDDPSPEDCLKKMSPDDEDDQFGVLLDKGTDQQTSSAEGVSGGGFSKGDIAGLIHD